MQIESATGVAVMETLRDSKTRYVIFVGERGGYWRVSDRPNIDPDKEFVDYRVRIDESLEKLGVKVHRY